MVIFVNMASYVNDVTFLTGDDWSDLELNLLFQLNALYNAPVRFILILLMDQSYMCYALKLNS